MCGRLVVTTISPSSPPWARDASYTYHHMNKEMKFKWFAAEVKKCDKKDVHANPPSGHGKLINLYRRWAVGYTVSTIHAEI